MEAFPLRPCASVMTIGKVFDPGVVLMVTTVEKEKVPLLAVASPLVPSSKNASVADPPMLLRSPVTAMPVLVGDVPGFTRTVSSVVPPAITDEGLATPTPLGLLGPATEFLGLGMPEAKSALLLSVSCVP